ncbi:MAG: hypothetical protein QXO75_06120 [Nitrososphaerota archaeon]
MGYKYCIIISAHNPPDSFYDTVKKLEGMRINTFVVNSGNYISFDFECKYTSIIKVKNYGVPHNFNTGIKLALDSGFDLFTLFTDDVSILPSFSKDYIIKYYERFCNKYDILSLIFISNKLRKAKNVVDSGMTFSSYVANKVKFRDDLVIDQQDIYFCYQIDKIGGKVISFDKKFIDTAPAGRFKVGKMHFLPSYRIYLMTRNSLRLFMETKEHSFLRSFLIGLIMSFKSVLGGEKNVLPAFVLGIIDALGNKLGITNNLQKLSNNRFQF